MVYCILRLPSVIERTGLSRSTIYRKVSLGEFPKPHKLGERAVGWLDADINDWVANQCSSSQVDGLSTK